MSGYFWFDDTDQKNLANDTTMGIPIPKHILQEVEERVRFRKLQSDRELLDKAEDQAKVHFFKTMLLRNHVQEFALQGETPISLTNEKPELQKIANTQSDKLSTKSPYCLVTINPRPGVTLPEFKKAVNKYLKKKTIPEYFQVYEVRKSDMSGLHSHILLRYTAKPYDFKRSTISTFKGVCDAANTAILNFKFVAADILPDKIKYLLGEKKESKNQGVKATIEYRKKNNLPQFTESSPPLTCRATENTAQIAD